jgi:hypothetical protein
METVAQFCAWIVSIAAALGILIKILKTVHAIVEGIKCQLRTDMLRTYYRHLDDGIIRQYEKENFEHNYRAYRALKGNSFIVDIYDEVKKWKVVS